MIRMSGLERSIVLECAHHVCLFFFCNVWMFRFWCSCQQPVLFQLLWAALRIAQSQWIHFGETSLGLIPVFDFPNPWIESYDLHSPIIATILHGFSISNCLSAIPALSTEQNIYCKVAGKTFMPFRAYCKSVAHLSTEQWRMFCMVLHHESKGQ